MPKKKSTLNEKQFNGLNEQEQIKELKKMSKRANVRLSLLEEQKQDKNYAYQKAAEHNKSQGKDKNRFYEGLKYKTSNAIKSAFKAVSSFLNNATSTMGGIQEHISTMIDRRVENGSLNSNDLLTLTTKEKKYASKHLAQIANKKLTQLEKKDMKFYAYDYAENYNKSVGRKRNRFYRGLKFKDQTELDTALDNEVYFVKANPLASSGFQNVSEASIEKFREKGINIPKGKEKEFFDFLGSEEFKNMARYGGDSNQVAKTYADARDKGEDVKQINEAFTSFMNGELDMTEVKERLKVAEWEQGGLFH